MKTLIVGGTGLTGAHAALYLREQGYDVTLASRSAPDNPLLADFPHLAGSYIDDDFTSGQLAPFDALVFAAGADIRLLPPDEDDDNGIILDFKWIHSCVSLTFYMVARDTRDN